VEGVRISGLNFTPHKLEGGATVQYRFMSCVLWEIVFESDSEKFSLEEFITCTLDWKIGYKINCNKGHGE